MKLAQPNKLQTIKLTQLKHKNITYTIDYRLKEFRAYILGSIIEPIKFDSTEGIKLLQKIKEGRIKTK
jgi:hypothetical protein